MISFAYPWALAALILVPLLYLYERFVKKPPSIVVPSARPFATENADRKRRRFAGRPVTFAFRCFLTGFALLIVALARPRLGDEKVVIRAKGIDIILALDMSGSMQAFDVPGSYTDGGDLYKAIRAGEVKNRLDTAKAEIRRFIEKRPNDRIGLLGFSDLAYSFAPPTLDHDWLITRLQTLTPGMIGDATGIASPIGSAISRLKGSDSPRRVLVLFTDGANTAPTRVGPEEAAKLAKEFDIIVHTVGIGSGNAYVLLDTPFGKRFQRYDDQFDEALLKKIADTTGGTYFNASGADGMKEVMARINELEKTTFEQPRYIEYREYAPVIALAALAALLLGLVADTTFRLRLP